MRTSSFRPLISRHETALLDIEEPTGRVLGIEVASALLLYLGVEGELPQLQHHSLLFTRTGRPGSGDLRRRDISA